MQQYKHNYYLTYDYPDDWLGEYDDGQIVFENRESPMGALLFSVFYPPADAEVDLKVRLEDMVGINAADIYLYPKENMVRFQYITIGDRSWRYWAIKRDAMVLFGSYNCELSQRGKEDDIVDRIVNSIFR